MTSLVKFPSSLEIPANILKVLRQTGQMITVMDVTTSADMTTSADNIDTDDRDAHSSNNCLHERGSTFGEAMWELERASEILMGVELDLAYSSEKLSNLDILLMHVAAKESDYEALENDNIWDDYVEEGLQFVMLSGILDSEVRELQSFLASLQTELLEARQILFSCEHLNEYFFEMEEKLKDSEKCFKQSQIIVSDMRMQSAKFQRTLLAFDEQDDWTNSNDASFADGQFSQMNTEIKMQTTEEQRRILWMLEKSLARELDMEKKLLDSRNSEEELKRKLRSAENELFCFKEAAEFSLERLFEADNAAEVLMGMSNELTGRLQILQFNLNSAVQREEHMRRKLEKSMEQMKTQENAYSEASQEKQNMLYSTIRDMENVIEDLKSKVAKAESAEVKCTMLSETNMKLNEELTFLRGRTKCLETSLHQGDEAKTSMAKDITIRTKLIINLVLQLAMERERLQKKISSLTKANKILAEKFSKPKNDASTVRSIKNENNREPSPNDGSSVATASEEAVPQSFASSLQVREASVSNAGVEPVVPEEDAIVDTVRTIDAGQLNLKYYLLALLIFFISVFAVYVFELEEYQS